MMLAIASVFNFNWDKKDEMLKSNKYYFIYSNGFMYTVLILFALYYDLNKTKKKHKKQNK